MAFALQADGWWLRSDIIWHKTNPMPESVTDRPTKAHEYVFLLTKRARYWYDADAIKEKSTWPDGPNSPESIKSPYGQGFTRTAPTWEERKQLGEGHRRGYSQNAPSGCHRVGGGEFRNRRSVWTLAAQPTPEAHFATFPLELPEICLRAGCPEGGLVLDPFSGAGTTGLACLKNGRNFLGIELNPAYVEMSYTRARKYYPLLVADEA